MAQRNMALLAVLLALAAVATMSSSRRAAARPTVLWTEVIDQGASDVRAFAHHNVSHLTNYVHWLLCRDCDCVCMSVLWLWLWRPMYV